MNKGFTSTAGMLILISSFALAGCPKKAPSVEGSAGISKTKPSESLTDKDRDRQSSSLGEEKVPMAKDEPLGGQTDTSKSAVSQDTGETPNALEDVFFDYDQWTIRSESKRVLEGDAKWLAAHPGKIQIEGHGDERGTNEYNLVLGEKRAKSAMNFLVNLGVNASRISIISYGEEKPFCTEHDESCYQKNRRAHFNVK